MRAIANRKPSRNRCGGSIPPLSAKRINYDTYKGV